MKALSITRAYILLLLALLYAAVGACDDKVSSRLGPTGPHLSTVHVSAVADAAETRTSALQAKIDDFHASGAIDNAGIAKGLKKLLSNVADATLRENLEAAENMMHAFRNRVHAQRGKHIAKAAADELLADAQEIIDLITDDASPTSADLSISMTATPDPVTVGEEVTHAITVGNAGPSDVTDLQASLLVAGDVQQVSAPDECTVTSQTDGLSYDCLLGSLTGGSDATLMILVAPQTAGETLSSQADIITWTGADDPDLTNNLVSETTLVTAPPTVQIALPEDGSLYTTGEEVTFSGSGTDPEDGSLTGTALVWTSSLDGQIGTGETFTRSDLSGGTHTITLTGTDSDGATATASISIEVTSPTTSQGGSLQWTRILGPATDVQIDLRNTWGTSATDVWAVGMATGSRTAILRYDGTEWTEQPTGTLAGFLGVWGSSPTDVFFVGANVIRHYDGSTWSFHDMPVAATLYDAWGTGSDDVWAVGNSTILHYDGTSWAEQLSGERLFSVHGTSGTDVWAVGPTGIFHYDGAGWVEQSTGIYGTPASVWASGSDVFFVGYNGYLVHYDSGSDTWTKQALPSEVSSSESFYKVWGTSPTDLYAVGTLGTVIHYDGSGWSRIRAGGPHLSGLWGAGTGELFAVGDNATILAHTGSDWSVHSTGLPVRGVWGAGSGDVYAVADVGTILHYDGSSWTLENTGLTYPALTADFHGVSGTSSSDVWVVGQGGAILHYDGVDWSESRAVGSGSNLNDVWANGPDDVFAVGASSTLLHYDGSAWNSHSSLLTSSYQTVHGAAGNAVWAVGSGGAIAHYDGTGWSAQSSGTTSMLFGIWAAASNRAFATGNVLGVLRYDGTSWTEEPLSTYSGRAVWGASLVDVFALPGGTGSIGDVLHYDGSTWTIQDTGVNSFALLDLWGSSATDVYVVGGGGTVIHGTP